MKSSLKLISFILLNAILLGSFACKKEDDGPQLPPETHLGKNTFGCKVNGNIWLPKTEDFLYQTLGSDFEIRKKKFVIGAGISTNISQSITIVINNFIELPKEYILQDQSSPLSSDSAWARFRIDSPTPIKEYYTNNIQQGKLVIIRIDSVERIATGRFEFEAKNGQSGQTVKITEGRFDIRYNRFK